jgi:hypothetical protein
MGPFQFNRHRRWLLGALSASVISPGMASDSAAGRFRVFDAMLHRDKPDLTSRGLEPIVPIAQVWRADEPHDRVNVVAAALAVERLPATTRTMFFDIEEWPIYPQPASIRDASVAKFTRIAEIARTARPSLPFGFYGVPPVCAYWPIVFHDASYQQWLEANRALTPVAQAVDFLFPSLYTFYDDRRGWLDFAKAQMDEARRYGKPVYPFLWFEYFDGNEQLRGKEVAAAAWEEELDFCLTHADGVVIWGGSERQWNEQAVWWRTTLRVLGLRQA